MKKSLINTVIAGVLLTQTASACTRVLHHFKNGDVMTGRSMDWYVRYQTDIWKFPRGVQRSGLTPKNPAKWISKYGSVGVVQTTQGQSAICDGMNEKGLTANLLYLTETKYAPRDTTKAGIASSLYLQYLLDNFATVADAVAFIKQDSIQIVPVPIPNSPHLPTMHIALSDAQGDSAIIEFIDEKVVIHHSKKYQVMTNSPTYEEQLALTAYWDTIGGHNFLPGTRNSPDRFVRASFYNAHLPEAKNYREEVAGVMSIVRNASSPFGRPDPEKPNVSTTLWRTLADQTHKVYYFESTIAPNFIWVDLKKLDFSPKSSQQVLSIDDESDYYGDVTQQLSTTQSLQYAPVK